MNPAHEFKRLKEAFQNREKRRFNTDLATVLDVAPHAQFGYVTAQLAGERVINVQAWNSAELRDGQQIMVQPISGGDWNWWVMIGANGSTDPENTPYEPPKIDQGAMPEHSLESHTGTLDWARIDTSTTRIDLTTQVTGNLPLQNQELQPVATRQTVSWSTPSIAPDIAMDGSVAGPRLAYVRRLEVTGGDMARIRLLEDESTVEYETTSVATPFIDYGGFFHAGDDDIIRWNIRNDGSDSVVFQVTLDLVSWP